MQRSFSETLNDEGVVCMTKTKGKYEVSRTESAIASPRCVDNIDEEMEQHLQQQNWFLNLLTLKFLDEDMEEQVCTVPRAGSLTLSSVSQENRHVRVQHGVLLHLVALGVGLSPNRRDTVRLRSTYITNLPFWLQVSSIDNHSGSYYARLGFSNTLRRGGKV